jgi:hypothetical protein
VITAQVDTTHQATSKATAPLGAKISEMKQKNNHNKDTIHRYIATSLQEKYPHSREQIRHIGREGAGFDTERLD